MFIDNCSHYLQREASYATELSEPLVKFEKNVLTSENSLCMLKQCSEWAGHCRLSGTFVSVYSGKSQRRRELLGHFNKNREERESERASERARETFLMAGAHCGPGETHFTYSPITLRLITVLMLRALLKSTLQRYSPASVSWTGSIWRKAGLFAMLKNARLPRSLRVDCGARSKSPRRASRVKIGAGMSS